jgi:hypothetical protein
MSELLLHYHRIDPGTWAYLSSLLMIGLYFKFNRVWSVRNLDLVLLILLAPGLLMVHWGEEAIQRGAVAAIAKRAEIAERVEVAKATADLRTAGQAALMSAPLPTAATLPTDEQFIAKQAGATTPPENAAAAAATAEETKPPPEIAQIEKGKQVSYEGYLWLFAVSGLFLIRMLLDPTMVRRPLLEPNLTSGGLLFLGVALFLFLMANVITSQLTADDLSGPQSAEALLSRHDSRHDENPVEDYRRFGPGYVLLSVLPSIPTMPFVRANDDRQVIAYAPAARAMAILSHLAVISALIIIGYWHFENIKMGIGAATLYLMLPYTAQLTGRVEHVLPAALLMWAIVLYRRPALAGVLIGLAMGAVYYPLFLLPLWISFYWQRGVVRFLLGVVVALSVAALSLAFVSADFVSFWHKIQQMFGLFLPNMDRGQLRGIWRLGWDPVYRIPALAACIALAGGLAIWPAQKNLGTLLSCSAAVMVAIQFWHGYGGGLYMAWYLPLALLTVFRPNLEDRVAMSVLGEAWFTKRRARLANFTRAA